MHGTARRSRQVAGAETAGQRRGTPYTPGVLDQVIHDALPRLMQPRVIDAVLEAQAIRGAPVTSQEARTLGKSPVMRHTRAFTEVAWRIARLGPDERGRVLCAAGKDRKGLALWWVEEQAPAEAPGAAAQ